MADREHNPEASHPTKYGALGILSTHPLAANPNHSEQSESEANDKTKHAHKDTSNVAHNNTKEHEDSDFDDEKIQHKMNGLINTIQSASPDHSRNTSTNDELQRPKSPFVGEQAEPSKRITSPQLTKEHPNVLVVDKSPSPTHTQQKRVSRKNSSASSTSNDTIIGGDLNSPKHEKNANKKQQKHSPSPNEKLNSSSTHKENHASEQQVSNKKLNRSHEEQKSPNRSDHEQRKSPNRSDHEQRKSPNRHNRSDHEEQKSPNRSGHEERKSPNRHNRSDHEERESSNKSPTQKTNPTKQQKLVSSPTNTKKQNQKDSDNESDFYGSHPASSKHNKERTSSNDKRHSPIQKRTGHESKHNSSIEKDSKKSRQHTGKRLSTTDSDNDHRNTSNHSKNKRVSSSKKNESTKNNQRFHGSSDHEKSRSRSPSPNVRHIGVRNKTPEITKKENTNKQYKKEVERALHRSRSNESINRNTTTDDKSNDLTSDNNTETEQQKRKPVKGKNKNAETETDQKSFSHDTSTTGNYQQHQRSPAQKSSKPASDHVQSTTHPKPQKRHSSTEHDSDDDKNRNNKSTQKHDKEQSTYHDRHVESDTGEIKHEKQPKPRRPKRISRTTQTYEHVFRRMEREQNNELMPITDTDKHSQTKDSQLNPRTKSSKIPFAIIQEMPPKNSARDQRSSSKASNHGRPMSPQSGRLLILRPTLPIHHANASNIQRINLQYSIDLVHKENKKDKSTTDQRSKSNHGKNSEQAHNLPRINSSSSTTGHTQKNKSNKKEKSPYNKTDDRNHRRKTDGNV
ncbi:unnamed protein product [Adineta steineri]|uniref:Uncharacterized protein n=1 Tax=Adineta steineri TaxID=433720 RepID=A0A813ZEE0_9BILA|nr:unnamed protein product [Adineta steineri]CAF1175926.1 unnamed protein product [Adineta steineri]